MIRYLKNDGYSIVKFNDENLSVDTISNIITNIDWLWILDEDGEFDGTPVEAGDILIRFLTIHNNGDRFAEKEYVLVKDEALKNYYKRLAEYRKKLIEDKQPCSERSEGTYAIGV